MKLIPSSVASAQHFFNTMVPWDGDIKLTLLEIPGEDGRPAVQKCISYDFGFGPAVDALGELADFFQLEVEECNHTKAHIDRPGAPKPVPIQITMLSRLLQENTLPLFLVSQNTDGRNQIDIVDMTQVRAISPTHASTCASLASTFD